MFGFYVMKSKSKNLIIISGPSGVGKDSVISRIQSIDSKISLAISVTTRKMRLGEKDGVNYHFLSRENFEKKIENSEFLEYSEYCGNYYGTLKKPIEKAMKSGRKIILKIDIQGAEKVREIYDDCFSIFILPPSIEALKERITLRNLDSKDDLDLRLKRAMIEIENACNYDFAVENDVVDSCARKIIDKIYELEKNNGV